MDDENLYTTKFFPQPSLLFPDNKSDRWQKIDDYVYGRQKVADDVNGMELHRLNLQVLWRPVMLPSPVRPHRIPMFKIRNLPRRPQAVIETLASIRGVHRKKEVVKNRRRVHIKKRRLEIVTGELNAEFDRFVYYFLK